MTSPRGPLPARVYWVRRTLVLVLALALVFGIGTLLTGFGGNPRAVPAAATSSRTPAPTATASATVPAAPATSTTKQKGKQSAVPLSVPTGVCDPAKLDVVPALRKVDGGGRVALRMQLTSTDGTCTWRVSRDALVVKITSGTDRIWSSQDCPASIATQDVVVRPNGEKPTQVDVTWNGRRSHVGCPSGTAWADIGYYHVVAAALGGRPTDVQFRVVGPPRPVVTKTTHPKPKHKKKGPASVATPKG